MAPNSSQLTLSEQQRLLAEAEQLMQRFNSLLLATQAKTTPELSYAPYTRDEQGCFYIFISDLASHTGNLQQHADCQLMFIADEGDSRNLFARQRLTWQCLARRIDPDELIYRQQMEVWQQRFGSTFSLLQQLPDFRLFQLCPVSGRYVVGFGRAYRLDPNSGRIEPIGP